MFKSKNSVLISMVLGIIFILLAILFFFNGIFKFTNRQNSIYSIVFFVFYAFAFIIPFVILNFAKSIKTHSETLDFENNAENKKDVFSKIFLNYKKTFLPEQNDVLGAGGKTRTNADLYFNTDELCEAQFSFPIFPIMKIITGTFVGLGILGTFIGFSAAIPNKNIMDVDELDPLFKGLNTAFNTSIVGVFSSIFYNFLIVQPLLKLLNQNSKELSDKLDKMYFVTDVEAMESLAHIVEGTLDTVQSNTKDLAEKFKDSSTEIFTEAIAEGKDALNREMNSTAMKLSEIAEILQNTPNAISTLNDELNASILESSKQTKIQLETTVQIINTNLNEKFQNFADKLKPSSENLKFYAEKIENASKQIETLPEKINEIHTSFSKSEEELSAKIQDIAGSLRDAISAMGSSYDTILEAIRNTLTKIDKTKNEIDSILEVSKENNNEISNNLKSAIEQYGLIKDETKNMLSGYLQVDKSLASIFDQIKNQFENYTNGVGAALTKYMDGFAEGTKNYTTGFTASVEEIKTAFEDMESMIENLQKSEEKLALLPNKIDEILSKKINQIDQTKQTESRN